MHMTKSRRVHVFVGYTIVDTNHLADHVGRSQSVSHSQSDIHRSDSAPSNCAGPSDGTHNSRYGIVLQCTQIPSFLIPPPTYALSTNHYMTRVTRVTRRRNIQI